MARRELVAACGLIGALGGALFGYGLERPQQSYRGSWEAVLALTVCTAISGTLLGLLLARSPPHDPHRAAASATGYSFLLGAFNGGLMVVAMSLLKGPVGGGGVLLVLGAAAIFGGVCALPFIPAMVAVAVTASRVDAPPGSAARRSQRRRVLRVAALSLAIASIVLPNARGQSVWLRVPVHVTNLALAAIVSLLLVELSVLWSLRGPAPDGEFGTYRSDDTAVERALRDRARTREIVRTSLRGHLLGGAVALGSLALQLVAARSTTS